MGLNIEASGSSPPFPVFQFQGKNLSGTAASSVILRSGHRAVLMFLTKHQEEDSNEQGRDYKAVIARWFTEFWGKDVNLAVVDEIAAADMLLKYSLQEPCRGRNDIKAFMTDFRVTFPDLNFWGTADLIAEGEYVVGQWEGGGTPIRVPRSTTF
jgi:SnoaL-like polyketide cyclase